MLGSAHRRVFAAATPLGEAWSIVTPRHQADWQPGRVHWGIHVVDGAITILPRAFYFSDTLVFDGADISRLVITLSEQSATVVLKMGDARRAYAHLRPHEIVLQQPRIPLEGTGLSYEFTTSEGKLFYLSPDGPLAIGPYTPGRLELSIVQGSGEAGRVASLKAWNEAEEPVLWEELRGAAAEQWIPAIGTLFGGLIGLGIWSGLRHRRDPLRILRVCVLSALPALVFLVPAGDWLKWTEHFYLSETAPWILPRLLVVLLLIPALSAGLISSGLLSLAGTRYIVGRKKFRPWLGCWFLLASAALLVGARPLEGVALAWLLPMTLFALAPLWMMRQAGLRSVRWVVMDLPALIVLVFLGWGQGLLIATLWRMVVALSSTREFLDRGAQPAVAHLLLLLLTMPVAVESAIRSTYLSRVWDAGELSLHDSKDRGWRTAVTTWSDRCGPESASKHKRLLFAGGSSTGSFNSYSRTHIRYFPELVHTQLCARLPADTQLETVNYGGGDRNTFTIARTMDQMLTDGGVDLFVLYGGVNDLFSQRHPKTRKQRFLEEQSSGAAAKGLKGLSARLRLVSGLSLPFRTLGQGSGQVSEVPLEDAEENHRLIISALDGAPLLLLTERVRASQVGELVPYERMQASLASDHSGVHHLSLSDVMAQERVEPLLADSPHYTQAGHSAFAAVILPGVEQHLFGD
jgi:hypothetical protein